MHTERADLYTRVTASIIAELEKGVRPWMQPWNSEHLEGRITRPLRSGGEPYKGINVLMLWDSARRQGFTAPAWMTIKQANQHGARVKPGSKGSLVVYADRITRREEAEDGEEIERDHFFMKGYTVFNAEQIAGLPAHFYAAPAPHSAPAERLTRADAFFARTGADIRHGGRRAYYAERPDFIQLPPFEAFRDAESHAATLAHELTHWTKHASRLARDFGRKRLGDAGYAREELVAEIGSAFLCCDLGITPEIRDDHASYLDHWLKVLREDRRAIFAASAHAQKAVDFLHSLQPRPESLPCSIAASRPR